MTTNDIALSTLSFNGVAVRDKGETLSLTDMWKAQGADPARQPSNWLASADARRFIDVLGELNPGNSGNELVKSVRGGKSPGTWAHWQIGLAYAKYLSPEFHMWCNTVVRERMEGKPAAPVAISFDADMRKTLGGIVKSVVHSQLVDVMPQLVAGYIAEHSLSIADGVTAGEVCGLSRVAGSYPRGIAGRVSKRMTQFCAARKVQVPVTRLGNVRAQLFPTHLAREWLDLEGRSLIKLWVDEKKGQTVLRLVSPIAAE